MEKEELLTFENERVVLSEQAKGLPEFDLMKTVLGEKVFYLALDFMYFVHSKKSIYFDVSILDRKNIVCTDRLGVTYKDFEKRVESKQEWASALKKFNALQFSKTEQLLEGTRSKVDEYLVFYQETTITLENQKTVMNMVRDASELIDLMDKIERKVLKEKSEKQFSGGESKMFEDGPPILKKAS